jgi:hypothetical protein
LSNAHIARPAAARHRAIMSATSHDAIPQRPGRLLKFDAPALDGADPTEDIADEITSELGGDSARGPSSVQDPAPVPVRAEAEHESPPSAGSVLRERYVLEALIGSGGTAMVFSARDRRRAGDSAEGARVAVKLLRPERSGDARSIARLQREFRQTDAVAGPHVVRVFDLDCDRGTWFIVMELLEGQSLAAHLRHTGPAGLPRKRALTLAAEVAEALAHAHARGVVHGDVKPANIFVTARDEPRLLDFGAAPGAGEPPEPITATRAYASPEVQGGALAEPGDDVFSLACVACELLSGEHPFGRGRASSAVRSGALLRRPDGLSDASWQVLACALDGRRTARPRMDELARALREAAAPAADAKTQTVVPAAVQVPAPVTVAAPPVRRMRLVAGAVAAAAFALVLGIFIGRLDPGAPVPAPLPSSVAPAESAEAAAVAAPVSVAQEAPAERRLSMPGPAQAPAGATLNPTGQVSFEQPAMTVSNRAVVAAIPLRHLSNAPRDARVNWRIIEGSARSGQDFGGPVSGTETFAAGNTFRILYVPIVANAAATRDRTFVVELTGATPGVQLGRTPRVAVTILGDR